MLSDGNRWRRLEQLAENDMQQFRQFVVAVQNELEQTREAYNGLTSYFHEASAEVSQTNCTLEVQSMHRGRQFVESLRLAIQQQETVIQHHEGRLAEMQAQMTLLYQKKESYLLLAQSEEEKLRLELNRTEQKVQDELAQQSFLRKHTFQNTSSKKDI